jgi:hypothetical protein
MPTLLRVGPYRFFMVMFDCLERPHIHARGGSIGEAKLWLVPSVSVATTWGYTARELARIRVIVARNAEVLIDRWLRACQDMTT